MHFPRISSPSIPCVLSIRPRQVLVLVLMLGTAEVFGFCPSVYLTVNDVAAPSLEGTKARLDGAWRNLR